MGVLPFLPAPLQALVTVQYAFYSPFIMINKVELISTLCVFSLCSDKEIWTIWREITCKE